MNLAAVSAASQVFAWLAIAVLGVMAVLLVAANLFSRKDKR